MVRSPIPRPQPRSPRAGRPQRGASPPFSRPQHRRSSNSPGRRRPNSRGGGVIGNSPCDDPRRRVSPPHHGGGHSRHRGPGGGGMSMPGNGHSGRPSQPQLSDTNRMPVASMRMRMDDYAPPKQRRNDQGAVIPPLMEQVVVRARREASTRTKDTFWTKKLLDAEDQYSKRGDRWAHSGFKELYRDELGYSEPEQLQVPGGGAEQRDARDGLPPRDPRGDPRGDPRAEPRDPRDPRRSSPNRPRDPRAKPRDPRDGRPSPDRPRDPRDPRNAPARPRDPRRTGEGGPGPRKDGSPRRRSRSRSRGRLAVKKSPSHRRRRSYSGSFSSGSSSSSSGSYSRSRSYYSRSSYSRSSSGSSSFSSSSSSRSRSRSRRKSGKRKHSGSRSYSSSVSPTRNRVVKAVPGGSKRSGPRPPIPPGGSKDKKPAGVIHEKKVVTKTVSNVVTTKTKLIGGPSHQPPSHGKQSHRVKSKLKIKEDELQQRKKAHGRAPPHPDMAAGNSVPSTSYYPNDEVNDATIATRSSNGGGGMAAVRGSASSPNLLQPPPPITVQHHHHHHSAEHYPPSKAISKKALPPPPQQQQQQHPPDFPPPNTTGSSSAGQSNSAVGSGALVVATLGGINPSSPHSQNEESDSSSSSEEEELPRKMTLSERFGKLAQLSSQRQEYDGVRMKIVREGGQDKKVYLEPGLGSRSPSPLHPGHERWLAEHQTEYAEYQRRYGDIRSWDPHRDLPHDLPPNWEEVGVRYRYYKQSGYFGDRHISLEDYLKWEDWWYQYRDWLKKYGGAAAEAGMPMPRMGKDVDMGAWGDTVAYDRGRVAARWPQDGREVGPDRKRRRF